MELSRFQLRELKGKLLYGIDFDIERGTTQHWDELDQDLANKEKFTELQLHIECPFPDSWLNGLPAASRAAGSDFIPTDVLVSQVLPSISGSPRYGGVTLWSKFYDNGYSSAIKPGV
ncbi:hypothetical protein RDI58_013357 [Solanum bulbocastanum]|uniref:Uncharacterized protein n=1 Tax=Solanum bulbocastanum TaxID=147425 RepID=A0AAN8TQJ9_SOLBU